MTRADATTRVQVLLCINIGYVQHAAVCIVSLLENNEDLEFEIVVVSTDELGSEEVRLRQTLARYRNCTLTMRRLDASLARDLPLRAHYSIDIYTRLWVSDFFGPDIDKVLYLDSDLVVTGPIEGLWHSSMGTISGNRRLTRG